MKVLKDDVIDCGHGYFIHGLNGGYRVDTINGKEVVQRFYNVWICDSADLDKTTWSVVDRVWKETEQADRKRILLFGFSASIIDQFEYAKCIISSADNNPVEVYDFEELIKKVKS